MISVEEARARILAELHPTPAEIVALAEAWGRITAAPVVARLTQPPVDVSAMDGYALRAADGTLSAVLHVVGSAPAGHPFDGIVGPGRLEQGDPHVVVLLEADRDLLADVDVVGFAPHDVRRETYGRVLGERDVGDHIRRLEVREPLPRVDRVPDDCRAPRHFGRLRRAAPAHRADRDRRVHERRALLAALDAQLPVGARRPEPFVERCQLRERSHRFSSSDRNCDESYGRCGR